MRDLGDERLDRPGVRHVVDRAEPADPDMRLRLAALQPDIRHVERRVDEAHAELDELRIFRIGHEVRKQARRRAAVAPGHDLVVLVEAGFEAFRRHGVIEAVPDVVLAGPHHLDRRAVHRLGQERRLDGEVPFRLAAEAAAKQRVVQGDVLRIETEPLGDIVAGAARRLHRRPDLELAVGHARRGGRRLHGRMRKVRRIILAVMTLAADLSAASASPSLRSSLPGLRTASSSIAL